MNKMMKPKIGIFLASVLIAGAVSAASPIGSRLAVLNARIITLSDRMPEAEAMVIEGERIIYTGNRRQAEKICGPECWMLDLNGLTVVPGFNDNHTHTLEGGLFYLQPNLFGKNCEEIVGIVKEEVKKAAPGDYIFGHSWDYDFCPAPHRKLLDQVTMDHPVFLSQFSGHGIWVNSYLLNQLEITRDTPNPLGGEIERDEKGNPTGILKDRAAEPAYASVLTGISSEKRRQAVLKALELYRAVGITSVQDNTYDPRVVWMLSELKSEGKLTCRFTCWAMGEYWYGSAMMRAARYDPGWITLGPVKIFTDGAFSTKTAWMTVPYAGEPGNYGLPRHPAKELSRIILEIANNQRQVSIHAIGDQAVHYSLEAINLGEERYPSFKQLRNRIEHIQMILPEDLIRFSKLSVLPCVQPFALSNPKKDLRILGEDRAKQAYPYKSLLDAGATLSFGSDFPNEVDFQPLLGIYYAVTRKNKSGDQGPLNPDQALTAEEALRAYTLGSAYAEFMEKDKGSLEPGKLADFVVLSENPLKTKPARIKDIKVVYTFVGGKQVWPERR